jgi:hypothetical protein
MNAPRKPRDMQNWRVVSTFVCVLCPPKKRRTTVFIRVGRSGFFSDPHARVEAAVCACGATVQIFENGLLSPEIRVVPGRVSK